MKKERSQDKGKQYKPKPGALEIKAIVFRLGKEKVMMFFDSCLRRRFKRKRRKKRYREEKEENEEEEEEEEEENRRWVLPEVREETSSR